MSKNVFIFLGIKITVNKNIQYLLKITYLGSKLYMKNNKTYTNGQSNVRHTFKL